MNYFVAFSVSDYKYEVVDFNIPGSRYLPLCRSTWFRLPQALDYWRASPFADPHLDRHILAVSVGVSLLEKD